MSTHEATLKDVAFFRDLSPRQIAELGAAATKVAFRTGEFVFREGDEATRFYIVTSGSISLEIFVPAKGAVTVATIHEGDALGWSWLFPPYRWHFDARALRPTTAIAFDAPCLRSLCDADHTLGYALVTRFAHTIAQRLQATRLQLLDTYGLQSSLHDPGIVMPAGRFGKEI